MVYVDCLYIVEWLRHDKLNIQQEVNMMLTYGTVLLRHLLRLSLFNIYQTLQLFKVSLTWEIAKAFVCRVIRGT